MAADGSYPFFVFRQSERGWLLLGQMRGTGYTWTTQTRHLVFTVTHGEKDPQSGTGTVRYEVNPAALVNLTALAREEAEPRAPFKPDWNQAF